MRWTTYGGWRDVFTEALESLTLDPAKLPQVLWCFYADVPSPSEELMSILRPGLDRNRITLYRGIDCNSILPMLVQTWDASKSGSEALVAPRQIPLKPHKLSEIECDRPPSIEAWVGREAEFRSMEISSSKVIAITGIGGEGKSALASEYVQAIERGETDFVFWDWRDCREEGDRLRTQILAAIERISGAKAILSSDRGSGDADLVEAFLRASGGANGVFILDNVDAYVDLEKSVFTGLLDRLVRGFCDDNNNCKLVITCRPNIYYNHTSFFSIAIRGLTLSETIELFEKRGALSKVKAEEVEAAHVFTNGHAFWLDLLALQVARVPGKTLSGLLDNIRRGRDNSPDLLTSIWGSLPEREQIVLRAMAEIKRPEGEEMIEKIVSHELTYSKFKRALKQLINLNLLVVKTERNAPDKYDLHPLVRQFLLRKYEKQERSGFIETLLKQIIVIINGMNAVLGVYLPFPLLERWSHKAELEIEAGKREAAANTLFVAKQALLGGGHVEEFVRVARKFFESVDQTAMPTNSLEFDSILVALIESLDDLEQIKDADDFLDQFEQSIPAKTARYIRLCDARCRSLWGRGEYQAAIEWGARGHELKRQSNVDTPYDCEHNLALARRDGGDPANALSFFLKGNDLGDVLNPSQAIDGVEGSFYGNVGRCLQLSGNLDGALIYYKKSITLLEFDESSSRLTNQAYARQWIAEVLEARGEGDVAMTFYMEAEAINSKVAPGRARNNRSAIAKIGGTSLTQAESRRRVERWIRNART